MEGNAINKTGSTGKNSHFEILFLKSPKTYPGCWLKNDVKNNKNLGCLNLAPVHPAHPNFKAAAASSVSRRDRPSSGTVKENQLGLDATPEPPTEAPAWIPRPGGWRAGWGPHARSQTGRRRAEARVWVCCCVAPSLARVGEGRAKQEGREALTQATRETIAQGWGLRVPGTRVRGVDGPRRSLRGPRTQSRAGQALTA